MSDFENDKVEKQGLILETLASHCTKSSTVEDLRIIAHALENGDQLAIENLSSGYTNFTYKVFLSSDPSKVALFAKLCFPRALWNPDPDVYYDVIRTTNEYEMMKRFSVLAPGCVVCPYFIIDIDEMKLLVTQWSQADEQMVNQFIDGVVDLRCAKNLALSVAALHGCDIDPKFNTDARECILALFPTMKEKMMSDIMLESGSSSRAVQLAKDFGEETCTTIVDRFTESYRAQEIATHADLHAFNCLVEKKPDINHLEEFGPKGAVVICDWEMAMSGPLGIDSGRVFSIPVVCIIVHAINGNNGEVSDCILKFLDIYWQEYAAAMKKDGKSDDFLKNSYLNTMGWLGWKIYAMSMFGWFIPFLPIEKADISALKESIGVIGLKLQRWGFVEGNNDQELSLVELHARFHDTIQEELSMIKSMKRGKARGRRRSSLLRKSNRRVSDASYYSFQGEGRSSWSSLQDNDLDF